MKRIVSVSIGSSIRDHKADIHFLGEDYSIERIGTDGDVDKAIDIIKQLDGKVDAFGMGGIDLYVYGEEGKKYVLKAALPIARAARITPMVDGSGLKNTLERRLIRFINLDLKITLKDKKVLLVCAMDRFGMAEGFEEYGASVTYGDIMFALGLPIPIYSLKVLRRVARVLMPIISNLPIDMIYPTGKSQEKSSITKYEEYYKNADIIAGDYLFIRKYMPSNLKGKIIITNTVTSEDINEMKQKGLKLLVTSTPEFNGRSFGTNVIEALFVSVLKKSPEEITSKDYDDLLDQLPSIHRVVSFDIEENVSIS